MHRPVLLTLATVATLAAGTMIAHGRDSASAVVAQAAAPAAVSAIDDAVAAAVIGSISGQFDTDDVTVQLADVDAVPLSIRDRELRGSGRLRIDGHAQWIPFRFAALYDTQNAEVSQPRLQLGGAGAATTADASITRGLEAQVAQALTAEFAGQPVAWKQGATRVSTEDSRFVHVVGKGLADFGAEGRVDARVDALYDRRTGRWLRVSYELGGSEDALAGGAVASL
ncbi:MAG: hypothetical protein ACOY37_05050 [Pseudomonadota bacterium]